MNFATPRFLSSPVNSPRLHVLKTAKEKNLKGYLEIPRDTQICDCPGPRTKGSRNNFRILGSVYPRRNSSRM
jgi:hypothetical protein